MIRNVAAVVVITVGYDGVSVIGPTLNEIELVPARRAHLHVPELA